MRHPNAKASPDPHATDLQAFATEIVRMTKGNTGDIKNAWLAKLVVPGDMLYHVSDRTNTLVYVIGNNEYGVIGWHCRAKVTNGLRWFSVTEAALNEKRYKVVLVSTLDGWRVLPVKALPPASWKQATKQNVAGIKIVYDENVATAFPIAQWACHFGFNGFTTEDLKNILRLPEVDFKPAGGRFPELEYDCVEAAIKHFYEDVNNDDVGEWMSRRHMRNKPPCTLR